MRGTLRRGQGTGDYKLATLRRGYWRAELPTTVHPFFVSGPPSPSRLVPDAAFAASFRLKRERSFNEAPREAARNNAITISHLSRRRPYT